MKPNTILRRTAAALCAVLMLGALTACKDTTHTTSGDPNETAATKSASGQTADNGVSTAYPDREVGFQLEAPAAGETVAILHTSKGDISLRFFPEAAPKAVENFLTHAKEGYYDGLKFHRVINEFMIQGGDPQGTGTGGESIWKTPFEDEFDQKLLNVRGSVAMANSGANSNGSQFFINQAPADKFGSREEFSPATREKLAKEQYDLLIDTYGEEQVKSVYSSWEDLIQETYVYDWIPDAVWELYEKTGGNIHLDGAWRRSGGHTVFAQVYDGMDVVDAIATVEVSSNDGCTPLEDVLINTVTVTTYQP